MGVQYIGADAEGELRAPEAAAAGGAGGQLSRDLEIGPPAHHHPV